MAITGLAQGRNQRASRVARICRRWGAMAIIAVWFVTLAGCSDTDVSTSPTQPVTSSSQRSRSETFATAPSRTSELPIVELEATNVFDLLEPGRYRSDLLPLELMLETSADFNVAFAYPGSIIIESPTSTYEAYTGVGFFVVDTLIDSDALGRQRSRLPATTDLDSFLSTRAEVQVVERRTDTLGGRTAHVWRIEYTSECAGCWFELLFNTPGWMNLWGTSPNQVQELWTVEAPGSPIIMAVEAPAERFDEWSEEVQTHLFDGLQFGEPTGRSLQRPEGSSAEGFGPHAIGRIELEVVDSSRPTMEIETDVGIVVPAADQRQLLLSVAYPSDTGGFGSEPADGSFPLVVVAPALRDAAISLPAERQLASHGFVVVTVRFPESSFPGNAISGIPQQPADVSFVIDQIENGVFPSQLTATTDTDQIGLIGHSSGATTAFGLLAHDCCIDERLDAVVAHAGTPYDFDSNLIDPTAPILHVTSLSDQVAPADALRELHDAIGTPSTFAALQTDSHLDWLDPDDDSYADAFAVVLAFLDRHLREGSSKPADLAANSAFVEFHQN